MKKRWIFLGVLFVLGVTCALGPTTPVQEPERATIEAAIPADLTQLQAYIAKEEFAQAPITEGAEKKITWASDAKQTPLSVVYIHGFSATRQETTPLSQDIARGLGANLFETRLRGHGQPGEQLAKVSAKDWLEDAIEALTIGQRIGEKVIIISTSTGATLALWLATLPESSSLHSIILISPNLGPKDPAAAILTYPWANVLLPIAIPSRTWEPKNERQAKYWTTSYPSQALFPMQALVEYVRDLDTTKIKAPTLFIYNENDNVIDAARVSAFYDKLENVKQRYLVVAKPDEDAHVLVGEIVSPSQTKPAEEEILKFIREVKR